MAQGKAFTDLQKAEIIKSLEPFFKLGCNLKKACAYGEICYNTVYNWVKEDEALLIKIKALQNEVNADARKVLVKAIKEGDKQIALNWLSKKEKDEFSDRTELTGAEGETLFIPSKEEQDKINESLKNYGIRQKSK